MSLTKYICRQFSIGVLHTLKLLTDFQDTRKNYFTDRYACSISYPSSIIKMRLTMNIHAKNTEKRWIEILRLSCAKNSNTINCYMRWNQLYFPAMVLPKRSFSAVLPEVFLSSFLKICKKNEITPCFSFRFISVF